MPPAGEDEDYWSSLAAEVECLVDSVSECQQPSSGKTRVACEWRASGVPAVRVAVI